MLASRGAQAPEQVPEAGVTPIGLHGRGIPTRNSHSHPACGWTSSVASWGMRRSRRRPPTTFMTTTRPHRRRRRRWPQSWMRTLDRDLGSNGASAFAGEEPRACVSDASGSSRTRSSRRTGRRRGRPTGSARTDPASAQRSGASARVQRIVGPMIDARGAGRRRDAIRRPRPATRSTSERPRSRSAGSAARRPYPRPATPRSRALVDAATSAGRRSLASAFSSSRVRQPRRCRRHCRAEAIWGNLAPPVHRVVIVREHFRW